MLPDQDKSFESRFIVIILIFGLLATALFFRLFDLQIVNRAFYASLAQGQQDINKILPAERGKIYLQDVKTGVLYPAVINRTVYTLAVSPKTIDKISKLNLKQEKIPADLAPYVGVDPKITIAKIAADLAPFTGLESKVIIEKISNLEDGYKVLAQNLADKDASKIKNLKLTGVILEAHNKRYYPEKILGGQLLGFVTNENDTPQGVYGLEGYFNDELKGVDGYLAAQKDALGQVLTFDTTGQKDPQDGLDLVLTIDRNVQAFVCDQINEAVKKHGADGGSAVVMDPSTGEIIAMCSAPNFDPNNYGQETNARVYNNPVIFDRYEPGSIAKALTMAAGLNENKIQPDTTYVDTGEVKIADITISNSEKKHYGRQTMTQVLEQSINTGAVFVARLVGKDIFRRYFLNFGLGSLTGIELATEVSGDISPLDKKGEVYMATASFGQGITATPMQMLVAYAAIANHGKMMRPFIVKQKNYSDGRVVKIEPKVIREIMTDQSARLLTSMLVGVVERGHGKRAAVPGYYVAGKTGTAQVPLPGGGGYYQDRTIGSFVGYAPADHPRFVMLAKIDNPKDVQFAESSAAPLFGQIAKFLLNYYAVPTER